MKDKITLLMKETGCKRGEAELALEMCGYDVEKAVRAIPRMFHDIAILKGKVHVESQTLYLLFLVILNLKERALLRARAVASFNPAVCAVDLESDWFKFEKHLYACRLRDGSEQSLSQEVERLLADFFVAREAAPFYSEAPRDVRGRGTQALSTLLSRRFAPETVRLVLHKDVLDMGQFQEIVGRTRAGGAAARVDKRWEASATGPGAVAAGPGPKSGAAGAVGKPEEGEAAQTPGSLVLRISLEGDPAGSPAGELLAGDLVYAHIDDARDVAQYLAKLFGARLGEGTPLMAPVEAVETGPAGCDVCIRVRFSLGVCGDVFLPPDIRLKVVRKTEPTSWWRKLFGS